MRTGCHLIVNSLSGSRKRVAGSELGVWSGEYCVLLSGDITLNHALFRQRSTTSLATVEFAACIGD
jgi:hypothetical protein